MKIVPYRIRFEVDLDPTSGNYRFSKPTEDILHVEVSKDGSHYEVHTHDRGDYQKPGPYYQIAFRIEDPSPYRIEELRLCIDPSIFRDTTLPIDNDLYCSPDTRNDPQRNLWYQRSLYEQDENGKWHVVSENKKSSIRVECITTAGVFRVAVLRNGTILHDIEQPWIYILPSVISQREYIVMLNDLITLHEKIVKDNNSTVGIGGITTIERDTERIRKDIEISQHLYEAICHIMSMPSERQSKRYKKTTINKVKHYDSKVVRDYIRNGLSGKVLGIEFYAEHDTYENRIIKYVLKKISNRHPLKPNFLIDPDVEISTAVEDEIETLTRMRPASQTVPSGKIRTFHLHGKPPTNTSFHGLHIDVQANCVRITDHALFYFDGHSWVKLNLFARSKRELVFYLKHLVKCCDTLSTNPIFSITCVAESPVIKTNSWNNTVYCYNISNIQSINGECYIHESNDYSEEEYCQIMHDLSSKRNYISFTEGFYFIDRSRKDHKSIEQDEEERKGIEENVRSDLIRKKENAVAERELWNLTEKLVELLNDNWFKSIKDIDSVEEIRLTPKFTSNPFYVQIYRTLIEMIQEHPLLTNGMNSNAFGVISTHQVYEYWVFYKLLYQLQTLGFHIGKQKDIIEHFQQFIAGNLSTGKYSNFKTTAVRILHDNETHSCISIDIGYNVPFYTDNTLSGKRLQRVPDYYLHIKSNATDHWYFIDAKYKCFSRRNVHMLNPAQEVYDVAISKYIVDIGEIFSKEHEYRASPDTILGSYIIAANIDESPSLRELAGNNRLYGAPESILSDSSINQWNSDQITSDSIDKGTESTPAHRYGIIRLVPGYDEELQSLLQLIFEYIETGKSDTHHNLYHCWNCGYAERVIREKKYPLKKIKGDLGEDRIEEDRSRYPKYYVKCPCCKTFRVDNHCINCGKAIIKHTKGNFHRWDDSVDNKRWAFICPDCGSPVNGFAST